MNLDQLKTTFDNGGLTSAIVTPIEFTKSYMLIINNRANKKCIMTAQRSKSHEPRAFKSIDAAVASASKIGFKKITVQL
mgnify:CR=1 FL=1